MAAISRTANIASKLGFAGAFAFMLGPILAEREWATAFISFRVFGLGLLICLLALIFGVIGLWATRPAAGRAGRHLAWIGTGLGTLVVAIAAVPMLSARGVPMINDITTDTEDPPSFRVTGDDDPNTGRDLSYPGAEFATQQRAAYPDIESIRLEKPVKRAYTAAAMAAVKLGWEVTFRDRDTLTFGATDRTDLFGFVDDIVVRVREEDGGSIVDMRSKSRDGKSDMGANAARIRAFRAQILDQAPPTRGR